MFYCLKIYILDATQTNDSLKFNIVIKACLKIWGLFYIMFFPSKFAKVSSLRVTARTTFPHKKSIFVKKQSGS